MIKERKLQKNSKRGKYLRNYLYNLANSRKYSKNIIYSGSIVYSESIFRKYIQEVYSESIFRKYIQEVYSGSIKEIIIRGKWKTTRSKESSLNRGSVSGTLRGSVSGTLRGSVSGTLRGSVSGTLRGSVSGKVCSLLTLWMLHENNSFILNKNGCLVIDALKQLCLKV